MDGTLWRRLSPESRASLLGAFGIAAFLVLIAVPTTISAIVGSPPAIIAAGVLELMVIVVMAVLFVRVVLARLGAGALDRLRPAVLVWGVPVLAGVWLSDWTLGCVWVACLFLVVRGRWGFVGLGALLVDVFVALVVTQPGDPQDLFLALSLSLFTVFAVFIPIRLVVVSDRLLLSQEEVARLQVDEERTRIERDLHDILGRTLVSVSLRNQSALRLIERGEPARAAEQLTIAHEVITAGQEQLRGITHGPAIVDLESEVRSAEKLCARTGIAWDAHVEPSGTPAARRLVAAVIREAVTNMLKYSRPSTCWLRVREEGGMVVLSFTNDGCPDDMQLNPDGTGLTALRQRCTRSGGTLDARSPERGFFRVLAHVPVEWERAVRS